MLPSKEKKERIRSKEILSETKTGIVRGEGWGWGRDQKLRQVERETELRAGRARKRQSLKSREKRIERNEY